jgi:hypothetical protein
MIFESTGMSARDNLMPTPDADGFFDVTGVSAFARRRGCFARQLSDCGIEVTNAEKGSLPAVSLMAIAPNLWEPVAIVTACTRAQGLKVFEIDHRTARPKNRRGLNEIQIARICAADSLQPYEPTGRNRRCNETQTGEEVDGGNAGGQTLMFRNVLRSERSARGGRLYSFAWQKAVRTLADVGLLVVKPVSDFTLVRADCSWTKLAYLSTVVCGPNALDPDDKHALACLAEGLPFG